MTQEFPYIIKVECFYTGLKKPLPPDNLMTVKVPTLATLSETAIVLNQAKERDLEFLQSVHSGSPEYNGFNTRKVREEGVALQSRTDSIYIFPPH